MLIIKSKKVAQWLDPSTILPENHPRCVVRESTFEKSDIIFVIAAVRYSTSPKVYVGARIRERPAGCADWRWECTDSEVLCWMPYPEAPTFIEEEEDMRDDAY